MAKNFLMKAGIEINPTPLSDFGVASIKELGKVVKGIADQARDEAQSRVEPGKGPKPFQMHPEYEDTGTLMSAIKSRVAVRGFVVKGEVYIDPKIEHPGRYGSKPRSAASYGAALEFGFHKMVLGPGGVPQIRFFRYPWLTPAWQKIQSKAPKMFQTEVTRVLQDAQKVKHHKKSVIVKDGITSDSPSNNFASRIIRGMPDDNYQALLADLASGELS